MIFCPTKCSYVRGGDNSSKSESSGPHSARGSQGIQEHILFYCYPTKNAKMTRPWRAEVRLSPPTGGCPDPGVRTPISVSRNFIMCLFMCIVNPKNKMLMCFNSLKYSYFSKIAFTQNSKLISCIKFVSTIKLM